MLGRHHPGLSWLAGWAGLAGWLGWAGWLGCVSLYYLVLQNLSKRVSARGQCCPWVSW